MIFIGILLAIFSASSGHLAGENLMAHEENHCREFGIPPERWRVEYGEPFSVSHRCRDYGAPLIVDGCAVPLADGDCLILYPKGNPQ